MAITLEPLGSRVLVCVCTEHTEKTRSGIVIPDTAQQKSQIGEVVAVGPGEMNKDGVRIGCDVKPGDKIIFDKFAGTKIEIDGLNIQTALVLKYSDIIGVIRNSSSCSA